MRGVSDMKDAVCPSPKGGVVLDDKGLCPCGKTSVDCCHKDKIFNNEEGENDAVYELCKKHGKRHLCGE